MPRYRCRVEYDGSRFCGWQIQPNDITVQQQLQEALSLITRQPVDLIGAGRTDTGVHARGQVAAFDLREPFDLLRLQHSVNGILGSKVALRDLQLTHDDFHPRHDARERRYSYTLLRQRSPLLEPRAWLVRRSWLDPQLMEQEAQLFIGRHDFLPFSLPRDDLRNTLCTLRSLTIDQQENALVVHLAGNRFLHHMVRAIVGHLVDVGSGKLPTGSAAQIFSGEMVGPRRWAPPHGLVLEEVLYADDLQRLQLKELLPHSG